MHWKVKSAIQNTVSLLPDSVSYATYYWMQRHFQSLRKVNTISRLSAGIEFWKRIQAVGHDPSGKTFFEIGTGRVPLVPLAYWLMGAKKIITIDANPYLIDVLIQENLRYIADHETEIRSLFNSLLDPSRFDALLKFSTDANFSLSKFLDFCRIHYIAPGDAANTKLAPQNIDFHTSYTVLEHIPPHVLKQILQEGNRIMSNTGLFVHAIDYSDHFSHSDHKISAINFLQYSDQEWLRYAGNRYMYMNRLRHDDFIALFQSVGHHILEAQLDIDLRSQALLASGSLQLDARFKTKSSDVLAIRNAWVISQMQV